ncbi:MAG: trigger factor, partial [Pseudomonadota bacterium]
QMHVDVMPDFEPADVAEIKIERPTTPVSDAQIDEALSKLAEQNTAYEARGKTAKAREKDAVVIDFVGKVDGEAFEGGSAEGATLVLGSGQFIPGFEDQLVGVKAGEEKAVEVTFPEDYQADHLAGKAAIFDVKVSEVREPKTPDLDDAFAEGLGVASLEELKDILRRQIEGEHAQMSRAKAKRALLDVLDEKHNFDLPPGMVDQEFDQIWSQIEKAKDADQLDDEDKGKSDDELKADYRKIAERRVRLGLVLAEIGTRAEVKISQQDLQQGIIAEARKYPGQEKEIFEFISKNEQAQAQIRAPLYEDKVVDHLLETVSVDDVEVDRETLFKEDDV